MPPQHTATVSTLVAASYTKSLRAALEKHARSSGASVDATTNGSLAMVCDVLIESMANGSVLVLRISLPQ